MVLIPSLKKKKHRPTNARPSPVTYLELDQHGGGGRKVLPEQAEGLGPLGLWGARGQDDPLPKEGGGEACHHAFLLFMRDWGVNGVGVVVGVGRARQQDNAPSGPRSTRRTLAGGV